MSETKVTFPPRFTLASLIFLVGFAVCLIPVPVEGALGSVLGVVASIISLCCFVLLVAGLLRLHVSEPLLAVVMVGAILTAYTLRASMERSLLIDLAFDLTHVILAFSMGRLLGKSGTRDSGGWFLLL